MGGRDQSKDGGTNGRKEGPVEGWLGSCMGGREEVGTNGRKEVPKGGRGWDQCEKL